MQLDQSATPLPSVQCLDQIDKLVTENLRGEWIVRIEHTSRVCRHSTCWNSWGKALFAITESAPVIDAITACRANHPTHAIRLCAEKVRPETRLIFCVFRPNDETPSEQDSTRTLPASANPVLGMLATLIPKLKAVRNRAFHYLALAGTLFAVAFIFEEAAIA